MLEIKDLTKHYRNQPALQQVSITLRNGVYGLLGPNGAGKSTLMNIITDNLPPDSGQLCWDGAPIASLGRQYRRILGYTPQQQGLYDAFSGRRFLRYMAALKELPSKQIPDEVARTAGLVNLSDQLDKRLGAYSGGMKQRILVAQAMLGTPRLLVFDEPTAGLDPMERVRIRNLLASLAQERVVLIATHVVSDIESIADVILMLKKGRIISQGTPDELVNQLAPGKSLEDVYMHVFDGEDLP